MYAEVPKLVAKVTRWKTAAHNRFQCWDVFQLWDNGQVTIDHCVEDEEWGGIEESREVSETNDYAKDFFKAGFDRVIDQTGAMREEPL